VLVAVLAVVVGAGALTGCSSSGGTKANSADASSTTSRSTK